MSAVLEVKHLKTGFFPKGGMAVTAVDDVSFEINRGETLCLVGESGCGKSVTSLSIMQLIAPPGRCYSGEILFNGEDLLKKSAKEMRSVRGNRISMIYQEPMTSLDPVFTIGMQVTEPLRNHKKMSKAQARQKAVELLSLAGIPEPERVMDEYPHQLSGGMRQRVMIAMGLVCEPDLLIADEPTTALDVTIQAQILRLMKKLKKELNMTMLFITHDLGVVAEMADRVAVMYGGKIVESGPVKEVFKNPIHPYTQGLMNCIPTSDKERGELNTISGMVPTLGEMPAGCRFHPRCPHACDYCRKEIPELKNYGAVQAACHFAKQVKAR